MIVLNIDAAYKAVEILHDYPGFSVKPTVDGFVARIDGFTSYGKSALDATLKLFKMTHPTLAMSFYYETKQSVW